MSPLVSVITPAYNAETFLPETIRSTLDQTMTDFEVIIIDDGSTDGTLRVATEFARSDARIRVLSGPNQGPAGARNEGLRNARGRVFAFLDSDDRWFPDYLATQLEILFHENADVVTANAINAGGHLDGTPLWPIESGLKRLTLLDLISHENSMCIMSVIRRDVIDRIGGFDKAFNGNEDYELWLRAAHSGATIIQNRKPHGLYRRRDGSLSSDDRRMLNGILAVLELLDSRCAQLPTERAAIARQVQRFEHELAKAEICYALQRRDAVTAARFLNVAASHHGSFATVMLAKMAGVWSRPLLWAYHVRQAVRASTKVP
jgi:glycosyltransferase involved in cell wall biosynthesis